MALRVKSTEIISDDGNINNVGVATFSKLDTVVSPDFITDKNIATVSDVTAADQVTFVDSAAAGDAIRRVDVQSFADAVNDLGTVDLSGPVGGYRNVIVNANFANDLLSTVIDEVPNNGFDRNATPDVCPGWRTWSTGTQTNTNQIVDNDGLDQIPAEIERYVKVDWVTGDPGAPNNNTFLDTIIENCLVYNGQPAVISFWAKSSVARSVQLSFDFVGGINATYNPVRLTAPYPSTTIEPNVWTFFSAGLTVPNIAELGLTIDPDNAHLFIRWHLSVSSEYVTPIGPPLETNEITSGSFCIAQPQFEAGTEVTPFELYDRSTEELRAQRYMGFFRNTRTTGYVEEVVTGGNPNNRSASFTFTFSNNATFRQIQPRITVLSDSLLPIVIRDASGNTLFSGSSAAFLGVSRSGHANTYVLGITIRNSDLNRAVSVGELVSIENYCFLLSANYTNPLYLYPAP